MTHYFIYHMSKEMWEEYKAVQESGEMNMMEHPLMRILSGPRNFNASENYARCIEHFDKNGNDEMLVMV